MKFIGTLIGLLTLFVLIGANGFFYHDISDDVPFRCGQHYATLQDRGYDAMKILDKELAERIAHSEATALKSSVMPYELPVVFHVIHDGGDENLSDDALRDGLDLLNDAFANRGYYDQGTGESTDISFCLAIQDEFQDASTGINRVQSSLTDFNLDDSGDDLKALSVWSAYDYINIWVVKEIRSNAEGAAIGGFSSVPSGHGLHRDGIIIEAQFFRSAEAISALVHEVGHYLGLYHTFQGGCNNGNCNFDGDAVCDTPPDNSIARLPCSEPNNSCSTDMVSGLPVDYPDMINNYMDYSNLSCYNAFTAGQKVRMNFFIQEKRRSLIESSACQDVCYSKITLASHKLSYEVTTQEVLTIDMQSSNATTTSWFLDDVLIGDTDIYSNQFAEEGEYVLRFEAGNGRPECQKTIYINVTVVCPVEADMSFTENYYSTGESIQLDNKSQFYSEIQWTINGVDAGAEETINFTFDEAGAYEFCIRAREGNCEKLYCKNFLAIDEFGLCNKFAGFQLNNAAPNNTFLSVKVYGEGFVALAVLRNYGFVVVQMDFDLNILSYDTFVTDDEPRLGTMVLDGDEVYIALNNGEESSLRLIKFNLLTKANIWDVIMSLPNIRVLSDLLRNGNQIYLLGELNEQQANGCDALLMEFDEETGDVISQKSYTLGSCESFIASLMRTDHIIATGRYNFAGAGTSKMRHSVSKLDLEGNLLWSKLYGKDLNSDASLYTSGVVSTPNGMAMCGYGDDDGTSSDNLDMFFYTIDEAGNPLIYKSFNVPNSTREIPRAIFELNGNYFLVCTRKDDNGDDHIFVMQLDNDGNLMSTYQLPPYLTTLESVESLGDQIVLAGAENNLPVLISIDLPLSIDSSCDPLTPLEVEESQLDLFSQDISLETKNLAYDLRSKQTILNATNYVFNEFCKVSCEEVCGNGIDDNEDGFTDCDDPVFQDSCCCRVPIMLDLGPDQSICDDQILNLAISQNFVSIEWSDSVNTPEREIFSPGLYWVEAIDECGVLQRDSIIFSIPMGNNIDLGTDTTVCSASFLLGLSGFDNYSWYHNEVKVNCVDCDSLKLELEEGTHQIVSIGTNLHGCSSIDTLNVEYIIKDPVLVDLGPDVTICDDQYIVMSSVDSVIWQEGNLADSLIVYETGKYFATYIDTECHVSHTDSVQVTLSQQDTLQEYRSICQGDSILIAEQWETKTGIYLEERSANSAMLCDTIVRIELVQLLHSEEFLELDLCKGDSLLVGSKIYYSEGQYTELLTNSVGCDSLLEFSIDILEHSSATSDLTICDGVALEVLGERLFMGGEYEIITTNAVGCDSTSYITITEEGIYVPTIFDPKSISGEDIFRPAVTCNVNGYELSIYDRWGGRVFYTESHEEGWAGRNAEQGVYTYLIEVEVQEANVTILRHGNLTLLR